MIATPPKPHAAANMPAASSEPLRAPSINRQQLFRAGREVIIVHHNEEYRLRITRQNKLILTK